MGKANGWVITKGRIFKKYWTRKREWSANRKDAQEFSDMAEVAEAVRHIPEDDDYIYEPIEQQEDRKRRN